VVNQGGGGHSNYLLVYRQQPAQQARGGAECCASRGWTAIRCGGGGDQRGSYRWIWSLRGVIRKY
jgi:hypothetical protein